MIVISFIELITDMMLIDCRLEEISTVTDNRRDLLSEELMCGLDFHKRSLGANCQSLAVPYLHQCASKTPRAAARMVHYGGTAVVHSGRPVGYSGRRDDHQIGRAHV